MRCYKWNFSFKEIDNLYFYWVSLDETEQIHDRIRGEGEYAKTRQNILDYVAEHDGHGKPAWKDIFISTTINSLNYTTAEDLVEEWRGKVNKIAFQFHTSFIKGDPLWLPFGENRKSR